MTALCWLFGLVYLILAFLMFYYGAKLYQTLSAQIDSIHQEDLLKTLCVRVALLTSIFSLVFIARTVHNLFYTLNITQSYFPQDMLNPV